MKEFKVTKRFPIEKTERVLRIIDKYSYCKENYALNDEEAEAFKCVRFLNDYERVLFYAICELKSSRKIAELFKTNSTYASKSIKELREKVAYIVTVLKENDGLDANNKDSLAQHIEEISVNSRKDNLMRQQKTSTYKSISGEIKDCIILDHNGKDIFVAPMSDLYIKRQNQ